MNTCCSSVVQFSKGRWYAMEKFGTSSKCLTYTFGGNASGVSGATRASASIPS